MKLFSVIFFFSRNNRTQSVMHYSNYAFSDDGEETLISINDPDLKFGQRVQLTKLDVKQINKLYPCDKKIDTSILLPDMTETDIERKKRDEMRDRDAFERMF